MVINQQEGRSNVDKSFASREKLRFNPVDYEIWGQAAGECLPLKNS